MPAPRGAEARMSSLDYRVATEADRASYAAILTHAFQSDPATLPDWLQASGHENLRVLACDGEVVAGLLTIPMGQVFGGRTVPMMGVAAVGVRPDRLRRGHASAMMRAFVEEQRAAGMPLATLYASNLPLYAGVGYGQAGARYRAVTGPHAFRGGRAAEVHLGSAADFDRVDALYATWAAAHPGHLARGPYVWRRLREPGPRGRPDLYFVGPRDNPRGYVLLRRMPGSGRHQVEILDMVAADADAVRAIWALLGDVVGTMVEQVTVWTSPTDPFTTVAGHPPYTLEVQEVWAMRVVDVPGAIAARGYPPGLRAAVDLLVRDPVFGDVPYTVVVDDGEGRAEEGGRSTVRVRADALAGLFSGWRTVDDLRLCGAIDGPTAQLAAFGAMFAGPVPWMREMF